VPDGIGAVFQQDASFFWLNVWDNVAFGLRRRGMGKAEIARRVDQALAFMGLAGFAKAYPAQLSGGMRQRVCIARTLVLEPKVLLLDEPFGALDAKVRRELRRWLRRFHDEIQLTTVFVTHDQEEALEIADEVVIMNQARVEQVGTPQEVYDRPATPFVYQFLGNVNVLRAPALVSAGPRLTKANAEGNGQIFVRPHDIQVGPHDSGPDGLSAILRYIHSAGSHARLTLEEVQTRETIEAEISRAELADLGLKVNDLVKLRLRQARSFDDDYAI
jgi:sulfate transport system ATP-binding protein